MIWLRDVFNKHTYDRTIGRYRLLIINGHGSYLTAEFHRFCEDNLIILLCEPAHSSHLLQPLDVGYFTLLKKVYGSQVKDLIRNHINHITKLKFLPAFKAAFKNAITKENIRGGFRGAGLIPDNSEAVLSQLEIRIRTPTPLVKEDTPWELKTLGNPAELAS